MIVGGVDDRGQGHRGSGCGVMEVVVDKDIMDVEYPTCRVNLRDLLELLFLPDDALRVRLGDILVGYPPEDTTRL